MLLSDVKEAWGTDGFAIVPGYLTADELAPALDELTSCFPTAAGFHQGSDPRRARYLDDEFNGIDTFPFASHRLSHLAVHARIIDLTDSDDRFVATAGRPDLYAAEVSAAGPAGTVVAFTPDTLHRGTALTRAGGGRYTLHLSFRAAAAEWAQRQGWPDRSHDPTWYRFVEGTTPRQLALFGFPPDLTVKRLHTSWPGRTQGRSCVKPGPGM